MHGDRLRGKSKKDTLLYLQDAVQNLLSEELEEAVSVLVAVQDFLASVKVKELGLKTREEYTYTLHLFAQWCEAHALVQDAETRGWTAILIGEEHPSIHLHEVNDQVVYCFIEYIKLTRKPCQANKKELSSHTLALYVKDIKRFLNWCLLHKQYSLHVRTITVAGIEKPKIIDIAVEVFSKKQIEALFKACENEQTEQLQLRDRAILAMLLDTGIRATELCTLTIGNVCLDPKDAYAKVFGKGSRWGYVRFGKQAHQQVQQYLHLFRVPMIESSIKHIHSNLSTYQIDQIIRKEKKQATLFVNRTGEPMTKNGLLQVIRRLARWADIEGVRCSPHTFRHTYSANFMRNGGDIYTLSKLLRHSNVTTTEEYLKTIQQSEARWRAKSVLDTMDI